MGRFNCAADAKAVIVGETEGFAKVIANAETDEVLGVHICRAGGHGADR